MSHRQMHVVRAVYIGYMAYRAFEALHRAKRRRWWVRPVNLSRERLGFFQTCVKQLKQKDEEHFFKATRMSLNKYNLLLSLLKESLQKFSKRKPIDPDTRLAVTLLYLAHGCAFQFLTWSFKLGVSTVRQIVYDTCQAIWDQLHVIYLSPPNLYDWHHIAEKFFEKSGLPHCIGAIDGKHIYIVKPRNSGSLYYNYKKTFSITLLATCDADHIFTYVDVGAVGSQSDCGVFYRSAFGDNAFPLRKNLLRPFPGRQLPSDKSNFNEILSKARVSIEISFGILANRWRVLHTTIPSTPKNADKIVLATVVLHNFLMLQKDTVYFNANVDLFDENNTNLQQSRIFYGNRASQEAFQLRNILLEYLNTSR